MSWVLRVGTGSSSVLMAGCHSSCPFPWIAESGGHSVGIYPGVSILRDLQTFILFCSSRSHSLDTVLWAGLGMQPWAQSSRQEGSPKVDPQGAHRGQAERHKTELRPLEEDPAGGHPSRGRPAWRERGQQDNSPGCKPHCRDCQSAGAGRLVQESRGPTSSPDPDLVIPRGRMPGRASVRAQRVPGPPARTPSWCSIPGHPLGRRPLRVTTVGSRCCTGAAPALRCARSTRTAACAHIPVPGPCRRPLSSRVPSWSFLPRAGTAKPVPGCPRWPCRS